MMKGFFVLVLILPFYTVFAQVVKISGQVRSEQGEALLNVNINILNHPSSTSTDKRGFYSISVDSEKSIFLSFSRTGYVSEKIEINPGSQKEIIKNVTLKLDTFLLKQVDVKRNINPSNVIRIDNGLINNIPLVSGNFESVLKTLPGVSANNELSSQYSVRGGNFDENLVYINDVEIFRPFLARNGQQEGLSFINPELVNQAKFSAGGFEARYGDRLSSVLDIRYQRPDSQHISLSAGLLGFSATGKLPFKKSFTLIGMRSKTNQSILRSQPLSGTYQPQFYDFQIYHQSSLTKKLELSFFGDYNLSRFTLRPKSRETTFGTLADQYQLKVDYEGQEKDAHEAVTAALTLNYNSSSGWGLKWINSLFSINERETFDVEGTYVFDQLETNESSSNFGKIRAHRGIGVDLSHGRNLMDAAIYSTELRWYSSVGRSFWEAGMRAQSDRIIDKLNEYYLTDSAGYTLPYTPGAFVLNDVVNADNAVTTRRFSAFVQNSFDLSEKFSFSAGIRGNFNSYSQEFFISPRATLLYQPGDHTSWRFSAGSYNQSPFYRELRDFSGALHRDTKAQRSIHFLSGIDTQFDGLGTRLKFSSEIYYKKLDNLIPYKVENLRIRYFAGREAKGYAAGADFSLRGEFAEGLESSFRLSLMKTAEDIKGDFYEYRDANGDLVVRHPGYLRRPTDQRINISAFFQDKLFNSPSYKVHLTLLYGSALPVGPPREERYLDIYKIPSYRRADIGFSKDFVEAGSLRKLGFFSKSFESLIAYAEVFNLFNINNTVSFLWIKDVDNNLFAVPNYLTSRQLNFKIIAKIKNR